MAMQSQDFRRKFYTDSMYQSAGVNTSYLRFSNTERGRVIFQLSLLAHLSLDILRSREEAITTAARVKVLGLLISLTLTPSPRHFLPTTQASSCMSQSSWET